MSTRLKLIAVIALLAGTVSGAHAGPIPPTNCTSYFWTFTWTCGAISHTTTSTPALPTNPPDPCIGGSQTWTSATWVLKLNNDGEC
jgi:hypothetical protein